MQQHSGMGGWGYNLQDLHDLAPEAHVEDDVLDGVVTVHAAVAIVEVAVVVIARATRVAEVLLGIGGRNDDLPQVISKTQHASEFSVSAGEARILGAVEANLLAVVLARHFPKLHTWPARAPSEAILDLPSLRPGYNKMA
eukprot:5533735-Pleurochrysis_carterae.AAC.1